MIAFLFILLGFAEEANFATTLQQAASVHQEQLSLPGDNPDIYHLRYHLVSLEQNDIVASMGHVTRRSSRPLRRLFVELRVGDYQFDNTGFAGWENGFASIGLPQTLTSHALDLAAWRITDQAYKQAIEQYSRKQAQFQPPENYPGDYTKQEVKTSIGDTGKADSSNLGELAEQLSQPFHGVPGIITGRVYVGHEAGPHLIVDSEGMVVQKPVVETTIRAVIQIQCADGMVLSDSRLWSTKLPGQLPEASTMVADIQQMVQSLQDLSEAPTLNQEVVGPVLFAEAAAPELFRALLIPQLEGTPAEIPFDSVFGDISFTSSGDARLGRRVLPEGWNVWDDPTANPEHPSSFTHDDEGTEAARVNIVETGIVKDLLMSRVPRKGISGSNGHARGLSTRRISGRASQMHVEPAKTKPRRALHRRALRLASAYGRDWYLRVEALQIPATTGTWVDTELEPLSRPVRWIRVHRDGTEEMLRGGAFSGVQRFALRDIALAGPEVTYTYLAPPESNGQNYSPTGGMPTLLTAPEVLVGELEVVPTAADPSSVPVLPHPYSVGKGE